MKPDRFIESAQQINQSAKLWQCPHCARLGTLNRHGVIRGYGNGEDLNVRAFRYFCCNRRVNNQGCGKTFCVYLSGIIPRMSVNTDQLWKFLDQWLICHSVHQTWLNTRSGFSLESAYRWIKQLQHYQFRLTEVLCRYRAPAQSKQKQQLKAVMEHLICIWDTKTPLQMFQIKTQLGWFETAP